MSIDFDWTRLTTGPDGDALAHTIRDFIHDKFQQVTLPRFIRSVQVHTFEFGDECPNVEIKDISDPWAEFYEDDEEEGDNDEEGGSEGHKDGLGTDKHTGGRASSSKAGDETHGPRPSITEKRNEKVASSISQSPIDKATATAVTTAPVQPSLSMNTPLFPASRHADLLSRSGTPGIPSGASNLSYFNLPPLSTASGLISGPHTPLSTMFSSSMAPWTSSIAQHMPAHQQQEPPAPADADSPRTPLAPERNPLDVQVTAHITYTGSLSLSLTAELLVDYPMPSFMSIPLSLRIKGVTFEGVAVLAYLRPNRKVPSQQPKSAGTAAAAAAAAGVEEEASLSSEKEVDIQPKGRCQFCFLGEEEGRAIVGNTSDAGTDKEATDMGRGKGEGSTSALREIVIETAIGRQSSFSSTSAHHHPAASQTQVDANVPGGDGSRSGAWRGSGSSGGGDDSTSAAASVGATQHRPAVVLKNVGKVEKFVLEQVRRIFEEEFVWPSFWTVLI